MVLCLYFKDFNISNKYDTAVHVTPQIVRNIDTDVNTVKSEIYVRV